MKKEINIPNHISKITPKEAFVEGFGYGYDTAKKELQKLKQLPMFIFLDKKKRRRR